MSKNENLTTTGFDEYNYQDIYEVLVQVFGQGNFKPKENSDILCAFTLKNNSMYFRFVKANPVFCRLEVFDDENGVIFWENINTKSHLYERLIAIYKYGIFFHGQPVMFNKVLDSSSDDFDDDYIDPEMIAKHAQPTMFESSDDEEEEIDQSKESRFLDELTKPQTSIVPDIKQIRVVSLKLDGEVVAYRFKTDVGAFDMRRSVALSYGLGGFKIEKFITIESINGLYMSKSEMKSHKLIPDVSDCEADCRKLINALFQG